MRGANHIELDGVAGRVAGILNADPDDGIDERARKLLATLPGDLRLPRTRARYPHVVNQLAADWDVARRFLALMDNLLLDTRGGRQGFEFATVIELVRLREYYREHVRQELRAPVLRRDPSVWY